MQASHSSFLEPLYSPADPSFGPSIMIEITGQTHQVIRCNQAKRARTTKGSMIDEDWLGHQIEVPRFTGIYSHMISSLWAFEHIS